jgi:pyruvate kinase
MALLWGVEPALVKRLDSTDEMLRTVDRQLQRQGARREGETVVIVAGVPPNRRASTNLMKLHRIGAEDL